MSSACILISDITGSTQLYEVESNTDALTQISAVLTRMRQIIEDLGGHCVKSQGDDVLSHFNQPEHAFQAAQKMIYEDWPGELSVHVGLYYGEFLTQDGDIYGPPVNTAARLASLAKPKEMLLGDECFDLLEPDSQKHLTLIGELQLKGQFRATRVYACSAIDMSKTTVAFANKGGDRASRIDTARFSYLEQKWQISEGETLSIGRSGDNDIVLDQAWVSRQHGVVSVRRGQLEFTDHSSTGSVLQSGDGAEITVHRRATLLNGNGLIFLGSGGLEDTSNAVKFDTADMSIRFTPD